MRLPVLLSLLLGSLFVSAQNFPQGISYQAVARNANGTELVNTSIAVRFTILKADIQEIVWQEIQSLTTNNYGLFNTVIGTGENTGAGLASFDLIDWSYGNISTRVEVDFGQGYLLMGEMGLWAVPFALYSLSSGETLSDSLWTSNGSATLSTQEKVAIGTESPDASAALQIDASNAGFLPPRLTEEQRQLIANPATGLLVFQTDGTAGYYWFTGSEWTILSSGNQGGGDGGNSSNTLIYTTSGF
jgi:hypothetical protein